MIMKPLTMLVVASATATSTSTRMKSFFGSERTIRAAIMETEDIAFVKAINGVCSSLETCRISSVPRNVASMKMRRFTMRSDWAASVKIRFFFSTSCSYGCAESAFFVAS